MRSSEPLLQVLEVHGWQRGTGAALNTGKGLQHLGYVKIKKMREIEERSEVMVKGVTMHNGGERRETSSDLKVFIQSQTCSIFLNVFPLVTSP